MMIGYKVLYDILKIIIYNYYIFAIAFHLSQKIEIAKQIKINEVGVGLVVDIK